MYRRTAVSSSVPTAGCSVVLPSAFVRLFPNRAVARPYSWNLCFSHASFAHRLTTPACVALQEFREALTGTGLKSSAAPPFASPPHSSEPPPPPAEGGFYAANGPVGRGAA